MTRARIESFLASCGKPALLESGEAVLPIREGCFGLTGTAGRLRIEAWDQTRNVSRQILDVASERRGRLELHIEHFGGKRGTLALLDLAAPSNATVEARGGRHAFREAFRRMLQRQFPGYSITELSADPDLEHSLSPAFPRALLQRGESRLAAIAAPSGPANPESVLTFGLIWLDYLRRVRRISVNRLLLFIPSGRHANTRARVRWLDPARVAAEVYAYSGQGEWRLDPADAGNLDTRLDRCRRAGNFDNDAFRGLSSIPGVETLDRPDGSVSLRVRGLEFGRWTEAGFTGDIEQAASLAVELARIRAPDSPQRHHRLFRQFPELWLESQVRNHLREIDATLTPSPVYGQVPAFAAGDRGVIDLLAADGAGRLAVLELKASEDIHLPLQALDYWMRVKHHLEAGEFSSRGYFPGVALRHDPPRLLLIAPSLHFHPANEIVLRFLSPRIPVERVGLGVEWQKNVKVMFRMNACL